MYMSSKYLREFYERCQYAAQSVVGDNYEIILVNDGSPDNSLDVALALHKQNNRVIVVDLSRNFGHHKAMMTGMNYAHGERVFLIDCDLEEPPEVLGDWWDRLDKNQNLDVVYGVQSSRKGGWFERISGNLFYAIINMFSPVKLPANVVVARLMTARYVSALVNYRDQELYLFGVLVFAGFEQEGVVLTKKDKGSSTYTLIKRLSLSLNAITSFSNYPLYAIFYLGVTISILSFAYIGYLITLKLFFPEQGVMGWTSLAVSIWAVGGFILTALGVIGIYLAKIFTETKPRPQTIVRQIYGASKNSFN